MITTTFLTALFALTSTAHRLNMGKAATFGVLAGTTITDAGRSDISVDIGVYPGTAITGASIVQGRTFRGGAKDSAVAIAKANATRAYQRALDLTPTMDLTGITLGGGQVLQPGIYNFDTSAALDGTLTLDALNREKPRFVFKIGSTLTTTAQSAIKLVNGASSCQVFWQVGSSATLGLNTEFVGNIVAFTSITATTDATVDGGLYALGGAVTLDNNIVSAPGTCCNPATGVKIPRLTPLFTRE